MQNMTQTLDLIDWRDAFAEAMVGESRPLLEQIRVARRVSDTDCTVLITGETGTGKELMAQAIHDASSRKDEAFVAVNCAAIPDELIEDELFGHVAGAFTGAQKGRVGKVVGANGGTLFLDEVGELPAKAQAKLLRVLQERIVTPVGSDEQIMVDVRIVAATHRDLSKMAQEGSFREDLVYRLNVIPIEMPALRDRGPDVVKIADFFLRHAASRFSRNVEGFAPEAQTVIASYRWPGNIREMKNAIERAVLLSRSETVTARDLGLPETQLKPTMVSDLPQMVTSDLDLKSALKCKEQELIEIALEKTGGNRTEAAALLGLNRTTLVEKLKKVANR